ARAEEAPSDRTALRVHQTRCGAVAADHSAVRTLDVFGDAHDHRTHHFALLHAPARNRLLHRHDDDGADGGVLALRAAQHLDAHDATRAGIIRHVEVGLHLDHVVPRTSFLRAWFLGLTARLVRLGRAGRLGLR